MNINDLSSYNLKGNYIELFLNDGSHLCGSLPVSTKDQDFEDQYILFLDYTEEKDFYSKVKSDEIIKLEDYKKILKQISKKEIMKFEILEKELSTILLEKGKPIPNWLKIQISVKQPGYANVIYKIPQYDKWFELGDIRIKNKTIYLPLTLVFLSYAREDKSAVEKIMGNLHEYGILTWFDDKDLLPGDNWETRIEDGIEKSDFVIIFLSSSTLDKTGYKNKEIRYALNQYELRPLGKIYLIPILLNECEPPREFRKFHWLKTWENNWFEKLLASLGRFPKSTI